MCTRHLGPRRRLRGLGRRGRCRQQPGQDGRPRIVAGATTGPTSKTRTATRTRASTTATPRSTGMSESDFLGELLAILDWCCHVGWRVGAPWAWGWMTKGTTTRTGAREMAFQGRNTGRTRRTISIATSFPGGVGLLECARRQATWYRSDRQSPRGRARCSCSASAMSTFDDAVGPHFFSSRPRSTKAVTTRSFGKR